MMIGFSKRVGDHKGRPYHLRLHRAKYVIALSLLILLITCGWVYHRRSMTVSNRKPSAACGSSWNRKRGVEPSFHLHQTRLYIQNLNEGKGTPLTPEGVSTIEDTKPVSPDGRWVFAGKEDGIFLYPLEGDEPRPIRGMLPGDSPIQWSGDSRSLYVREESQFPAKIFRMDLSTGQREFWKEVAPSDPASLWYVSPVVITPDGKSYVYSYWRELSDLFLVEGLK